MTVDKLVRRLAVAVLAPALGQHVLFVRLYHREPLDFPKITAEAGFSRHVRISSRQPAHDLHPLQATSSANWFRNKTIGFKPHCQFDFETLLFFRRRPCAHAKRQSFWCRWDGSYKLRAMMANSVRPNGWRSASSPVPTRSREPRRPSRNFKRQPAAPQHKPLRRLKRVGTWSDSHSRRTGEA